jgi:hypothetical protein
MAAEPTIYSDWNTYIRDNLLYLKQDTSAHVYLSAAAMNPQAGTSSTCAPLATTSMATNKEDIQTLDFDAAAIEYAQSPLFSMPSDYNGGAMSCAFYWTHGSTTTNFGVTWQAELVAFANNQNMDTAWGTAGTVNDTGGTTNYFYISDAIGTVTPGGSAAAGCGMKIRIGRTATGSADTMTIDAKLIGVKLTYTRN